MSFITKTPENLAAVKERLELVLSCANVGMWDCNPQTNEVVFDDRWAKMLGLVPSALTQTLDDWSLRVHPNDLQSCFDAFLAKPYGKNDVDQLLRKLNLH
jgi:PAS domain-containing protein